MGKKVVYCDLELMVLLGNAAIIMLRKDSETL